MQGQYILEGMLNALIEMEAAGDALYKSMSEKSTDPKLVRTFEILANQESHHKHMYESYKNILVSNEDLDDVMLKDLDIRIQNAVNFLSDRDIPDNMDKAIEKAMHFEEDTIAFLREMKTLILSKYHSEIDILIAEEEKHLDFLKRIN